MQQLILTELKKDDILVNYWGYVQRTIQYSAGKEFIVTKNGLVTYAEANQSANVIFHALQGMANKKGIGIGLFMKDPRRIIPAMMGVLKSGYYFIPLDVNYPKTTLHYIFKNAEIKVVLTVDRDADRIHSLASGDLTIINLDELDYEVVITEPVVNYSPDDIVQILYTSGSTGQPKGAIEDYRYLVRAAFHKLDVFENDPDDRILQLSSFNYSAAHTLVFAALLYGVTICYYNVKEDGFSGLPEWINRQGIVTYYSTPTVFRSLISILGPDEKLPSVRNFSLGGEKRLGKDIEELRKHFPGAQKIRLGFAATETQAVTSMTFPIDFNFFEQEYLPSGKPYSDLRVYIWDGNGKPLPPGEEGEIVVHGDALARGYINNPELTRARFISDPVNPGWQYFKTGDLGKLLADGQLVHLGRMDNMVKIKGIRIEIDSIENHLQSYPGIVRVASRVIEGTKGNKKLALYFVGEKGIEIPISDLRRYLAERLPAHLLPHYLIGLDNIPLTRTNKVATNQLPLPQMIRPDLSNKYIPPADDVEEKLVEVWEELVGIEGIGVTDNFFDIGGDSLLGVLLFVKIEEIWGRNLPVSVLLKASTIRLLAEIIRNDEVSQDFAPVIPINTVGEHPPLFFIPGKGGYPTRIRHLAKKIDPQTPVYALQDLLENPDIQPIHSVESAAAIYLNEIKTLYPEGPYILIGESLGGKIAYEMAQQLLKSGAKAPVLIMLDTYNTKDHVIDLFQTRHNLPFYTMLIKKHFSILIRSNWQGKLDYLQFYRETIGRKTRHLLNKQLGSQKKVSTTVLPENVRQIEAANLEAARAYRVKPYPGRVILFKALRGPNANHPANGWDQVTLGELVIHTLDCYHGSILFDPAVSQLALILQRYIEENIRENA